MNPARPDSAVLLPRLEFDWPFDAAWRYGWSLAADQPGASPGDLAVQTARVLRRESLRIVQVHGDRIHPYPRGAAVPEALPRADGILTNRRDVVAGVAVADCLPVYVRAGDWYGVLHAGWRGVVGGIVARLLEMVSTRFATTDSTVEAVVGPGIGPCCFEVSATVAALFDPACRMRTTDGRLSIDLPLAVEQQWCGAGGAPDRLLRTGRCTFCGEPRMESFRRDGGRGRNYAFIYMR